MSNEFLNFSEISKNIQFMDVLNWLNIPYQKKKGELRGDNFIVSIEKNLFFVPDDENLKGSVINFIAHYKQIPLREAALLLKGQFLSKITEIKPIRDIPDLTLEWDTYIEERGINFETAKEYEIGLVKQRSIIAGRVAFKIYNEAGSHTGYIGYKIEDESWLFPKGFKRPLYNSYKLKDKKYVIVTTDPFEAIRLATLGLKQVSSLLANSMTTEQEIELKKYKYILLLHPEPHNIVSRLCQYTFIKAPVLSKPLQKMTTQELLNTIKPS